MTNQSMYRMAATHSSSAKTKVTFRKQKIFTHRTGYYSKTLLISMTDWKKRTSISTQSVYSDIYNLNMGNIPYKGLTKRNRSFVVAFGATILSFLEFAL